MRIWELARTGLVVAAAALSVGGCGGGSAVESGDRIKAKVIEGSDGSSVFVGLWDAELQTDCAYTTAADGKLRCLPLPGDKLKIVWSGDLHFSDPECAAPVAEWLGDIDGGQIVETLPKFGVVVFDADPTLELSHVFPVEGPYVGDGKGSKRDVYGDYCSSYYTFSSSDVFVQLGAEMPASRFVEGTEIKD